LQALQRSCWGPGLQRLERRKEVLSEDRNLTPPMMAVHAVGEEQGVGVT